jgi:hypothetical protein
MNINSEIIRSMLSFEKDDFYFVQVLKRRKDNTDMERDMNVIDNFYINSLEHYDKMVPQIIKLCDMENARAYFRLNKRNYKDLAPHMVKRVVEIAFGNDCHALKNVFDSVAGEFHSDKDKKWIIDIDWVDVITPTNLDGKYLYEKVVHDATALQFEAKREPLMIRIPTKNGEHLITRPFNLQKFKEKYPTIDVHKDNPTILYCP